MSWRQRGRTQSRGQANNNSSTEGAAALAAGAILPDGAQEVRGEEDVALAPVPTYIVEKAKATRSTCKVCEKKILGGETRVGVLIEGEWGLFTCWNHLSCTVFHKSIKSIEELDGWKHLDEEAQELVKARIEASKHEVDYENMRFDPDSVVRTEWSTPAPTPADMISPLLSFQEEGLGWMLHQEESDVLGGILADEMGMGKTMQAIALIMSNRPPKQEDIAAAANLCHPVESKSSPRNKNASKPPPVTRDVDASTLATLARWDESDRRHYISQAVSSTASAAEKASVEFERLPKAGTLVMVPTIALRQWQMEILRFTREGSLTVGIYHGDSRSCDISWLQQFDVVLTTYKIAEIEYRKATAGTKVECRICHGRFYPEKLRVHRRYFCGTSARLTAAQAKTQRKKQKTTTGARAQQVDSEDVPGTENSSDSDSEPKISPEKKTGTKRKSPSKGSSSSSISSEMKKFPDDRSTKHGIKKSVSIKKETSPRERSAATAKKKLSKSPSPTSRKRKIINSEDDSDSSDADYSPSESSGSASSDDTASLHGTDSEDFLDTKSMRQQKKKATPSKAGASASKMTIVRSPSGTVSASSSSAAHAYEVKSNGIVEDDDESVDSKPKKKIGKLNAGRILKGGGKKKSTGKSKNKAKGKGKSKAKGKDKEKGVITDKNGKKRFADDKSEDSSSSESDSASESDEDEDMSDVERDIAEALRKAAANNSIAKLSLLHSVSWFRVMLDEAHLIKDRSTSTAKAVFNLTSLYKWCLTGTPLQNRVGELYSLVRFLRVDPCAFYYCNYKGCTCKSLHYRFEKGKCHECSHTAMSHYCHFNKHILNPIKRYGYRADGRKAMIKLKEQVLDEVLLRRTKVTRAEDIQLPARIVKVRKDTLDEQEEDFYQALYTQSQAQFNTYVRAGTVLNNYAHIFDILIRLRQAVVHPYLVTLNDTRKDDVQDARGFFGRTLTDNHTRSNALADNVSEEDDDLPTCLLCEDPSEDYVTAPCGHGFCRLCVMEYIDTLSAASAALVTCPSCRKPITADMFAVDEEEVNNSETPEKKKRGRGSTPTSNGKISSSSSQTAQDRGSLSVWDRNARRRKSILNKIDLAQFRTSTKMEALMEELHNMIEREPNAKAIVFSQFVNMLDLLDFRIQSEGMHCQKILGSMSVSQRDEAITNFKTDRNVRVLLISLKAGGVALNLTVAHHIFLMDPWWNPAAEMQAIDRTHRIGQHRPIFATRFVIENSIEERILMLQEKKRLVFDGTVGGDSGSMARLSVDDIRFLFQ